jgi:hypothetical protein
VFIYTTGIKMSENNFKVRLIPISSLLSASGGDVIRQSQVSFDVTPLFSVSGSVEYAPVTPVHMPGSIQVYKHTNSRNFEITATFISRNAADALENMSKLQKLQSWRLPYFGATSTLTAAHTLNRKSDTIGGIDTSTARDTTYVNDQAAFDKARIQSQGVELHGAPPDVLYLYAYSTSQNDDRAKVNGRVNINRVPVVLSNLSYAFPDDVDYIPVFDLSNGNGPTQYTEPFPKKMSVTISLLETHSPREYERFDLESYKKGTLVNF